MATKATQQARAAAAAEPGADDLVFTSPHARLIIYHGKTKIAQFIDGMFRTSDSKIIEFLRNHELVSLLESSEQ